MSFSVNVQNLATRMSTEAKSLRMLINGNVAGLGDLDTTAKSNLVAAINEVLALAEAAAGSGGAQSLDGLSDVAITAPANGQTIVYNGTEFVNVNSADYFDPAGSAASAQAASQPVDSDLTAIAALATTPYGRSFLTLVNQAGLMSLLLSASESQSGVVELATTTEAVSGSDSLRAVTPAGLKAATDALRSSILGSGVPAALDTLDELAAALGDDANFAANVTSSLANKQPIDADLSSIAAQISAANKMLYATGPQTWALTDLTSFARTLNGSADASAARTTLDVYSKAEIGNPETNFVAIFEAGLV